ncbi:tetratricopeptide repeat protein [Billgrantia diversa]|uniref:tetratricopeptide repeat protein n=1 Tax=Halomonas sp. MCCC 1A13316 TaxID=2733487 RepID=UPI0018A35719|nr:tetratricopeptide repeat protein [Halomonas sp. MCCC 1A13316]QOR37635.1 tetratricopeptide repeat protein [Halomonas sp. MCCC 1A13316]
MYSSKIGRSFFAALLLAACSTASGEPPAHYLERAGAALMEASGDTQRLENALAIYDEGLELHPDNTELRSNRASLLTSLGRYEEAKLDLDELHEGGLHKEGMLLRCMLHERLEGTTDDALPCYAGAEAAFATASETSDQPNANQILAARLAGSPEAEVLLLEWQASEAPVVDPIVGELLEMEREELIRQFLP